MKHDENKNNILSRRQFLMGTTVLVASIRPLGATAPTSPETISVDLHSHAFISDSELNGFASAKGPDVSFLSGHPQLGPLPEVFKAVKEKKITIARRPADIIKAKSQGRRVAIISNEGGYVLKGDISNVDKLNAKGLVSLQLVRLGSADIVDYDNNLTAFGKDVVRAQNRLGMIVDLAHCTEDTIKQVAEVTTKPLMLSHFNKPVEGAWDVVAETGGIIGNWWSPKDSRQGMTFDGWIDGFKDMVDEVGIDHVGVQTELGTFLHRGPFDKYSDWDIIGQALEKKGFNKEETNKILGGNFMRMFGKIMAGLKA